MQLVLDFARTIIGFYPAVVQEELREALPSITLEASRLALEVMQAERDNVPYVDAVHRVTFPLMGRVHFGLQDLLQYQLPAPVRAALGGLAAAAKGGGFEDLRRSLFASAAGEDDMQSALLRFFLFECARIELLVATWELPEVEVLGSLARLDREAESIIRARLAMKEMIDQDVRPLNVVAAELFLRAISDADGAARQMLGGSDAIQMVLHLVEATRMIRGFDAANAAVARVDAFESEIGSQQLADRYPWHFSTPNAVDKRRSRLRRAIADGRPPYVEDGSRMIDFIRAPATDEDE